MLGLGRRVASEVARPRLGRDLGRAGIAVGSAVGRGIERVGSSRVGMAALGIGALGLGAANVAGPAARDAAFTAAFDDPNADIAFTGRKFDTRYLLGGAIGGPIGTAMQLSSPGDYLTENPIIPGQTLVGSPGGAAVGAGVGAGVGSAIGAIAGKYSGTGAGVGGAAGAVAGGVLGTAAGGLGALGLGAVAPVLGAGIGALSGRGLKGALIGGGIGALAGAGTVGASVASTAVPLRNYMQDNNRFFAESPYAGRTSASIASGLNASGDIVLGMHNSRRGY